jgi:transcriptional regulator with GAF, ATPase, and Fis domain
MPEAEPDLIALHATAVALARSMRTEPDARRFVDNLSPYLREIIPHDRLLLIPGGNRHGLWVPDVEWIGLASRLTVPFEGVERVIGNLAIGSLAPDVYTEAHVTTARRIAEVLAPIVENIVLLRNQCERRRQMALLPEVSRVVADSLDVGNIFQELGTAVRRVLDFDLMIVRPIGASGTLPRSILLVGNVPADVQSERRLEDYSFGARLAAKEIVLLNDAWSELDQSFPGDRAALEHGARSVIVAPLVFGDTIAGVLAFARHDPDSFDEGDAEVVSGIAAQLVVALQHQRLAEEQQRVVAAEQHSRRLERRVERLRGTLAEQYGFDSIVGRSEAFRAALDQAALVAGQDTTVLLTGESGTGKELVARAIHYARRRAEGPFVAVNCAALPETLAESELFGHERGAFTGADRLKRGRFELATGGTLFLDEIGDLTPSVQAKLLRVLQERQYERVGGTTSLRADVRLITATNRDLEHLVETGTFRADLYYRLAVFRIHLPALRERDGDVLALAEFFLRTLGERMARRQSRLSVQARQLLVAHTWPGNIRELQNAIERALIAADGRVISPAHLGIGEHGPLAPGLPPGAPTAAGSVPTALPLVEVEKQTVAEALRRAKGNKTQAAAALGLSRGAFYRRLERFGLGSHT